MAKKLPKRLFVKWNTDTLEEPFLEPSEDPTLLSEGDATIQVGEYELKAIRKLVNKTTVE